MNNRGCKEYREAIVARWTDALTAEAENELRAHIEGCPSCRREADWLAGLAGDLDALGNAVTAQTPAVDLVGNVMDAVDRMKAAEPRIIPLAEYQPRRARAFSYWASRLAAAAVLVVAVAVVIWQTQRAETFDTLARPFQPGEPGSARSSDSSLPGMRPTSGAPSNPLPNTKFDPVEGLSPEDLYLFPGGKNGPGGAEEGKAYADLTIDEILALRKKAVSDPNARAELARWASLTIEQARALAQSPTASLEARLAASMVLPPDEAERLLLAAAESAPDNPYVRYRLAETYADMPDSAAKEAAQLRELQQLESSNALAQYKLASSLFKQGDIAGASAALAQARSIEGLDSYGLDAASYQARALEEIGVDPDTARVLAALNGGTAQYADLMGLASQLIEVGKQQEQAGNYELAMQIYESVDYLGMQIASNAAFSSEALAGLDTQRMSTEMLASLYGVMGLTGNVEELARQTEAMLRAFNQIGEFFDDMNGYFSNDATAAALQWIAMLILQNGDLAAWDQYANGTGQ